MNYPQDLGKIQAKICFEMKERMNKILDATFFTSNGNKGTSHFNISLFPKEFSGEVTIAFFNLGVCNGIDRLL